MLNISIFVSIFLLSTDFRMINGDKDTCKWERGNDLYCRQFRCPFNKCGNFLSSHNLTCICAKQKTELNRKFGCQVINIDETEYEIRSCSEYHPFICSDIHNNFQIYAEESRTWSDAVHTCESRNLHIARVNVSALHKYTGNLLFWTDTFYGLASDNSTDVSHYQITFDISEIDSTLAVHAKCEIQHKELQTNTSSLCATFPNDNHTTESVTEFSNPSHVTESASPWPETNDTVVSLITGISITKQTVRSTIYWTTGITFATTIRPESPEVAYTSEANMMTTSHGDSQTTPSVNDVYTTAISNTTTTKGITRKVTTPAAEKETIFSNYDFSLDVTHSTDSSITPSSVETRQTTPSVNDVYTTVASDVNTTKGTTVKKTAAEKETISSIHYHSLEVTHDTDISISPSWEEIHQTTPYFDDVYTTEASIASSTPSTTGVNATEISNTTTIERTLSAGKETLYTRSDNPTSPKITQNTNGNVMSSSHERFRTTSSAADLLNTDSTISLFRNSKGTLSTEKETISSSPVTYTTEVDMVSSSDNSQKLSAVSNTSSATTDDMYLNESISNTSESTTVKNSTDRPIPVDSKEAKQKHKDNTVVIAGAVSGGGLLLIIGATVVYVKYRRNRNGKKWNIS